MSFAYRRLRRLADRLGLQVLRKRYTSPVPILEELRPEVWETPSELRGVRFDAEAQFAFLEALGSGLDEFAPPLDDPGEGYFARNDFFQAVDAQVLFAVLRRFRPRRVIELGSGFSTMVIATAGERNAVDGAPFSHTVVDPFPFPGLSQTFWGERELVPAKVEDVGLEVFSQLSAGDVLFVDTSHAVRIGGDVNFVVLDVLPTLADGVLVHFHDVYLPWQYPRAWMEEHEWYWTEQYLLQAFLAFNPTYEVLLSSQLLARVDRTRLARAASLAHQVDDLEKYQSLWLRRVSPGDSARSR